MPVNGMNARGEICRVGWLWNDTTWTSGRAENRFSSRGRKRCKQVEEQKSTMYVWLVHTQAPVHRRPSHTHMMPRVSAQRTAALTTTVPRRLMAQEGRDRNSFEAKGPSAENARLDKSVATATESLRMDYHC